MNCANCVTNCVGSVGCVGSWFFNCVVAIDARTGRYLWHFQEIRHDLWDLDMSAPPNLGTITRDGRRIDIVAACTKIGNTLLLDRVTGKPIFPFRLRRAPVSKLPGETTAPYQPDVEWPQPFARQVFSPDDVAGFPLASRDAMREGGRLSFIADNVDVILDRLRRCAPIGRVEHKHVVAELALVAVVF